MHESVMAHPHCQEEPQSLSKNGKNREDFLGPKENLFTALLLVTIKNNTTNIPWSTVNGFPSIMFVRCHFTEVAVPTYFCLNWNLSEQ